MERLTKIGRITLPQFTDLAVSTVLAKVVVEHSLEHNGDTRKYMNTYRGNLRRQKGKVSPKEEDFNDSCTSHTYAHN